MAAVYANWWWWMYFRPIANRIFVDWDFDDGDPEGTICDYCLCPPIDGHGHCTC